ncbi:MAG: T9SS type A sorting domain-containing protein [Bacteroidales bacterium]|jgi:hypothetical protein|nr:T9SS type A sorting domain-containing protein [Bacteroidales bacterium]MDD4671944.1 T9SS type A sorting domain-containing protein [Bacteroidales bacterium]
MKKIIFTIIFCGVLTNFIKSQDFSLGLFVTDSQNRKDSIQFGLNSSATMGEDIHLGEEDIYGQPWDSLDIRSIQRDIVEHNCLRESHFCYPPCANIYFDSNADFKIDFRPLWGTLGTTNMNFEILIKSLKPPIYITPEFSEIAWSIFEDWSAIHLLDENCNTIETKPIQHFSDPNEILFISNDTLTTLVVEFQHEVSAELNKYKNIIVYPNPAKGEINVISEIPIIIRISDILGKELKVTCKKKMSISEFKNGLYLIHIYNQDGQFLKAEKILIE